MKVGINGVTDCKHVLVWFVYDAKKLLEVLTQETHEWF